MNTLIKRTQLSSPIHLSGSYFRGLASPSMYPSFWTVGNDSGAAKVNSIGVEAAQTCGMAAFCSDCVAWTQTQRPCSDFGHHPGHMGPWVHTLHGVSMGTGSHTRISQSVRAREDNATRGQAAIITPLFFARKDTFRPNIYRHWMWFSGDSISKWYLILIR